MGVLGQSRDQGAAAVTPPMQAPVDRGSFWERANSNEPVVRAAIQGAVGGPHSTKVGQAIYETRTYDQIIQALSKEGEQGQDHLDILQGAPAVNRPFRNPYVSAPWENLLNSAHNPLADLYTGGDQGETAQIDAAIKRVQARKPGFMPWYKGPETIHALADEQRKKDMAASEAVTSRATGTGKVASFIGGMVGSVGSMDPENFVGGGFGTAAGKTIARTVIKRAVEGAGVNAAASLMAAPGQIADAHNHLGTDMTPADIAHQAAQAGAIGAVFGGVHAVAPHIAGTVGKAVGAVTDKVTAIPPVRDALVAASIRAGTVQDHAAIHAWVQTHNPGGVIDTSTPDERAAANVVMRDVGTREASPLEPEHAPANEHRLDAVAKSLRMNLSPEVPSPAPIQTPTVRDRSAAATAPRRAAPLAESIVGAEGRDAPNPASTADGYGQFTEGTWIDTVKRHAPEAAAGKSRAEILALRHDKTLATQMTEAYGNDNGRILRAHGLEDSPGNKSLAHFLGPSDAVKVLHADPATPIERVIDPKSFSANHKLLEGKSASEVIAWAHKRIGATVDGPVARADAVPEADGLDEADYTAVPHERATFAPHELETDAALMQYKSGGDENGVTGKLRDVTRWDPIMSSDVLAWEGLDGRRVIVDGHQRLGLAKRLSAEGQDITLPTLLLKESDGVTAAQARVLGALRNINLGTGTLIDNARVLREAPHLLDAIKGAENRREIEGLSKLSYEAFGAVLNDVIDPRIAAEIGKNAADKPDTHLALAGLLAKERISNPIEAGHIVRQASADGFGTAQEHQLGMFGDAPQQSLYVPIARIMTAAAKRLRDEKRTFSILGDRAGRIEEAGNVLDKKANQTRAVGADEAIAILNATAHRAGPVRDALTAAARAELSGSRRADAVNQFLNDLSGIDLRSAARGDGRAGLGENDAGNADENGDVRQLSGEAGSRDAAAEADRVLAASDGPGLFEDAVAARDAAEPFSDPVGEAAKAQADILDHDLRMAATESPRQAEERHFLEAEASLPSEPRERLAAILDRFERDHYSYVATELYQREITPRNDILGEFVPMPDFERAARQEERLSEFRYALGDARFAKIAAASQSEDRLAALATVTSEDIAKIKAFDAAQMEAFGNARALESAREGSPSAQSYLMSKGLWPESHPGAALQARLDADPNALFADYANLPDAEGGIMLSADVARELSPEYLADRSRSAEVHEAASAIVKRLYAEKLAGPTPEGLKREVLFTAGGTGAGKTTAVNALLARGGERPEIVYDTNMTDLGSAAQKIDQALAKGRSVKVMFVYRDPVEAYRNGVIKRAISQQAKFGTGRTVAIDTHLSTHLNSRDVVPALAREYANDPRVTVEGYDNSRGPGEGYFAPLDSLPIHDNLNLRGALDNELETARQSGRLSEGIYAGLRKDQDGRPVVGADEASDPGRLRRSSEAGRNAPDALDPAIAERQRQEAALKAASPLQSIAEQQGTMGLGLFDVADQPTFRLSDEGEAQPLAQIMHDAEADTAAAQALRDCLK